MNKHANIEHIYLFSFYTAGTVKLKHAFYKTLIKVYHLLTLYTFNLSFNLFLNLIYFIGYIF